MKRLFILCVLAMFLFCGCAPLQPMSDVFVEESGCLSETPGCKALSVADAQQLQEILDAGQWKNSITKSGWEYEIHLPDRTLYYTVNGGLLNDRENNIHLYLSDEAKEALDRIISRSLGKDITSRI